MRLLQIDLQNDPALFNEWQARSADLGEAQAGSKVDLSKLNQLMDAADGDDATGVVDRLAAFLEKARKGGVSLTRYAATSLVLTRF